MSTRSLELYYNQFYYYVSRIDNHVSQATMSLARGELTLYEYNVNYHFDPNIYSAYAVLAAYKA